MDAFSDDGGAGGAGAAAQSAEKRDADDVDDAASMRPLVDDRSTRRSAAQRDSRVTDWVLLCARCRETVHRCRCGCVVRARLVPTPPPQPSAPPPHQRELCIRCGRAGHSEAQCWHVNTTCKNCLQRGHIVSVCPARTPQTHTSKRSRGWTDASRA